MEAGAHLLQGLDDGFAAVADVELRLGQESLREEKKDRVGAG